MKQRPAASSADAQSPPCVSMAAVVVAFAPQKCPAAHASHAAAPAALWLPTPQGAGAAAPAGQKNPAGQSAHASPSSSSSAGPRARVLENAANDPASHAVGAVAPAAQNEPRGQSAHWAASTRPAVADHVPAGHGSPTAAPRGQYAPAGHGRDGAAPPPSHSEPASQGAHSSAARRCVAFV